MFPIKISLTPLLITLRYILESMYLKLIIGISRGKDQYFSETNKIFLSQSRIFKDGQLILRAVTVAALICYDQALVLYLFNTVPVILEGCTCMRASPPWKKH